MKGHTRRRERIRPLCSLGTTVHEGKGGESCGWIRGLADLVLMNFIGFVDPCLNVKVCLLSIVWRRWGRVVDSGLEGCSGSGGGKGRRGFAKGNVPLIQAVYVLLFVGRGFEPTQVERRKVHGRTATGFSGRAIW